MTPPAATPGDMFVVRTGGWAARLIRWATRSPYDHAGVVVDTRGRTVEATPAGATYGQLADYPPDRLAVGAPIDPADPRRPAIVAGAASLTGTRSGPADIASLGLLQFHVRARWVKRLVRRSDRLTCSQLVDRAYLLGDVELFADGRLPMDVTPADLAPLIPGASG